MKWAAISRILAAIGALAPAAAGCKLARIADIPVTMEGFQPLIHAKVNGVDRLFLADTGAFFSMTSANHAKAMGLTIWPMPYGIRVEGVGGEADVMMGETRQFAFAGAQLPRADFVVGAVRSGARRKAYSARTS